jgi:ketosteroid isomerase-like protein
MSRQNVEVVHRGFDLMNRGPAVFDEGLDLCDSEVEMPGVGRLPNTNATVRGHEAVKAWATGLYATLDRRNEIDECIDAGDSVVGDFRQITGGQ